MSLSGTIAVSLLAGIRRSEASACLKSILPTSRQEGLQKSLKNLRKTSKPAPEARA
jgi:hypothetical protein